MLVPKDFDWKQTRSFYTELGKLSSGDSIPATLETQKYVQVQRFIRNHQHVRDWNAARDSMIELADEYKLSLIGAARLFVDLQKAASRFAVGKNIESHLKAGDFLKDLEEISYSLNKVAKWSESLLDHDRSERLAIAEKHIENAAHFWAKDVAPEPSEVGLERLRAHGFEFHQVGQYEVAYDSYSALRMWLRNNRLFSNLVKVAIENEYRKREHDAENPDPGRYMPIPELGESVSLAGEKLPKMYERFTGKNFTWKTSGDLVTDEEGVKFVRMAMRVMGLQPIGCETVVKHVKKVRAKLAVSGAPGNG